eukprot:993398-Prorocentrum_lima.AAC.1
MTSSLVGSEMCIRDSTVMPVDKDKYQAVSADLLHRGVKRGSKLRMSGICLLYTSDAADDM